MIGSIGQNFLSVDDFVLPLTLGTIIILYTIVGVRSVSYVNIVLMLLFFVAMTWMMHIFVSRAGGVKAIWEGVPAVNKMLFRHPKFLWKASSSFFFALVFVGTRIPLILQSMLMLRKKREIRKIGGIVSVVYLVTCMLFLFMGFAVLALKTSANSQEHYRYFFVLFRKLFYRNLLLQSLFLAGFLAVLCASLSAHLHMIGVVVVHDIFSNVKPPRKAFYARIITFLVQKISFILFIAIFSTYFYYRWQRWQSAICILLFAMVILPLLLGLLGVKSDGHSWAALCGAYLMVKAICFVSGWHHYSSSILSIFVGILSYFITHLIIHGEVAMVDWEKDIALRGSSDPK